MVSNCERLSARAMNPSPPDGCQDRGAASKPRPRLRLSSYELGRAWCGGRSADGLLRTSAMKHAPYYTPKETIIFMSATEAELKDKTPPEPPPETVTERVERELQSLRLHGVLKKELPVITMSTWRALLPQSQADFFRAGGKLMDDPPPPKEILPEGAITRSAFMRMTREQKLTFARSGAKLFDDPDPADVTTRSPGTSELEEMKRKLGWA